MYVIRSDKPRQRLNSSRRCAANCSHAYESRRIVAIGLHVSPHIQGPPRLKFPRSAAPIRLARLLEKPVYQMDARGR
jgi:hypothetical protein